MIIIKIKERHFGHATFSTNISLSAKGNIKEKQKPTAAETLTELQEDTTSNLITDDYGNIRYSGKDVNNYVCMENEVTCSDDNLYRIIGVFNDIKTSEDDVEGETRIKLIKATSSGKAYWNTENNNNWTEASLNNILNTNSFSLYSSFLLENAVWNIGGHTTNSVTANQMYEYERSNETGNSNTYPSIWTGKVALMYPSDYGYASSECKNGTKNLSQYSDTTCIGSNWLFQNLDEWLLTPMTNSTGKVFLVNIAGYINYYYYYSSYGVASTTLAYRPSFYLKSNVAIKEDSERNGSLEHPYLLELIEEEE